MKTGRLFLVVCVLSQLAIAQDDALVAWWDAENGTQERVSNFDARIYDEWNQLRDDLYFDPSHNGTSAYYFVDPQDPRYSDLERFRSIYVFDDSRLSPEHITLEAWFFGHQYVGDGLSPFFYKPGRDEEEAEYRTQYALGAVGNLHGTRGHQPPSPQAGRFKFKLNVIDENDEIHPTVLYSHEDDTYPIQNWVHVVATYDGHHMVIYVDGIESSRRPIEGRILANKEGLWIARNFSDGLDGDRFDEFLEGRLDDLRIYNRALTAEEVNARFLASLAGRSDCELCELGDVIARNEDMVPAFYNNIQDALDNAVADKTSAVISCLNATNESLTFENQADLLLTSCNGTEVRDAVFTGSVSVTVENFSFNPGNAPGILFNGGADFNKDITIKNGSIKGGLTDGVLILKENLKINLIDLIIAQMGGAGIRTTQFGGPYQVENVIFENIDAEGADISSQAEITFTKNFFSECGSYAILRHPGNGNPQQITLNLNEFQNNNGQIIQPTHNTNLGNIFDILDASDDQADF